MVYKNIKKRTFEIIQASTEHDLASKIFDICLIVLVNQKIVSNLVRNFIPEKSHKSIMLRC